MSMRDSSASASSANCTPWQFMQTVRTIFSRGIQGGVLVVLDVAVFVARQMTRRTRDAGIGREFAGRKFGSPEVRMSSRFPGQAVRVIVARQTTVGCGELCVRLVWSVAGVAVEHAICRVRFHWKAGHRGLHR